MPLMPLGVRASDVLWTPYEDVVDTEVQAATESIIDLWLNTPFNGIANYQNARLLTFEFSSVAAALPGFEIFTSGTGAAANVTASAASQVENHPGIWSLATGTTAAGACALTHGVTAVASSNNQFSAKGIIDMLWVVRLPTLPDGTNGYQVNIGLHDGVSTAEPANMIGFQTDTASVSEWMLRAAHSAGTETTDGSGTTAGANSWHALRFVGDGGGNLYGWVDTITGTEHASLNGNIPQTSGETVGVASQIRKTVGASSRSVNVDFAGLLYQVA